MKRFVLSLLATLAICSVASAQTTPVFQFKLFQALLAVNGFHLHLTQDIDSHMFHISL